MRFFLHAKFDDGRYVEVTAGPRDQLAWEKTAQGRAVSQLMDGAIRIKDLYTLAHASMKRQGLYEGTLKEFEDSADVDFGHEKTEGEDAPEADREDENPTRPGPSNDH